MAAGLSQKQINERIKRHLKKHPELVLDRVLHASNGEVAIMFKEREVNNGI
jgi:hydroxymethylpyrimidine/phosphomethylpyrimidine kinase